MNKFAKGSLAAGAGLVLLLGGAGTLAYWNAEAGLEGGTINAGTLTLEADNEVLKDSIATQPATWVPGDEHTYSTVLSLKTSGDHIAGEIELNTSAVTVNGAGVDEFDLSMSVEEVTSTEGGTTRYEPTTGKIIFEGPGEYEIPVNFTVALPFDSATNASQGMSVDWSKVSFVAEQTDAADGE